MSDMYFSSYANLVDVTTPIIAEIDRDVSRLYNKDRIQACLSVNFAFDFFNENYLNIRREYYNLSNANYTTIESRCEKNIVDFAKCYLDFVESRWSNSFIDSNKLSTLCNNINYSASVIILRVRIFDGGKTITVNLPIGYIAEKYLDHVFVNGVPIISKYIIFGRLLGTPKYVGTDHLYKVVDVYLNDRREDHNGEIYSEIKAFFLKGLKEIIENDFLAHRELMVSEIVKNYCLEFSVSPTNVEDASRRIIQERTRISPVYTL